ncbi:restriction endonuclease [Escherichia coli]|nr:restriction endonuclease [Salmonella enterica subsp. enterica serovar Kentucky]EEV5949033.1 restriction endonuclease [Escherichia coli]EFO2087066.1 restriction endonuclease [Escherichia coli O109]EEV9010572.1 restriction endonuclease [Escherichia coli]EEW6232666.1 restriction endonuclease [Escherichia coli]
MLPSETMIWQPEFTDKTLSRKPGAVHWSRLQTDSETITQKAGAILHQLKAWLIKPV